MKDRIKIIRKSVGLTQAKFAERLGLKQNTIAVYEMGKSGISDNVIFSICREFNVNETWLRTGEGEIFKKRTKNQEVAAFVNDLMEDVDESFRKRFILAFSKFDECDWIELEKLIDKLGK